MPEKILAILSASLTMKSEGGLMEIGVELRGTPQKGEGLFATKSFKLGDIVMVGVIKEVLSKNHSHASQIGEHTHVLHDGLISKMNHCCEPNCGIRVNATGAHDFVAMMDIDINEETTFDYAMRNFNIDHFPKKCLCGAKNCRGQVTGWKDLGTDRKIAYEGFVAPYLLELDEKHLGSFVPSLHPHGPRKGSLGTQIHSVIIDSPHG
jgi:hypothetical protein